MNSDHPRYEVLCALATTGQLSELELMEFTAHAELCEICRKQMSERMGISRTVFLTCALKSKAGPIPKGMQERFIKRALHAGVPLHRDTALGSSMRLASIALLAMICLGVGTKVLESKRLGGASASMNYSSSVIAKNNGIEMANFATPTTRQDVSHGLSHSTKKRREAKAKRNSYFELYQPIFVRPAHPPDVKCHLPSAFSMRAISYVASASFLIPRAAFGKRFIRSFPKLEEDQALEEPTFHYDAKLASLLLMDAPQAYEMKRYGSDLNTSIPAFHLDSDRAW